MKRLLIVTVITLGFVMSAEAQVGQGSFMLGGGISSTSTKTEFDGDEVEKESSLSFGPSVGYFVSDEFAVGLNLNYAMEEASETDPDFGEFELKVKVFGVGPFFRYYKFTSNESLAFFAQGSLTFLKTENELDFGGDSDTTEGKGVDVAVSPGLAYFFNDRWSAELMFRGIGYTSLTPDSDNEDLKEKSFTIGLDSLTPTLSVRVYFAK